jgi:hypothetical protein
MRLYYRDSGTEITGVDIFHCQKIVNIGGRLSGRINDLELASITTAHSMLMQQVEVRKDDGSTVLWEGIIEKIFYDKTGFIFEGISYLGMLADVNCRYNGIIAQGTITSLADDYIIDTELTTAASMVGKSTGFIDQDVYGSNIVMYVPNSNTAFYNGGVAASTETGTFADLATSGNTKMYLSDDQSRARDYYGIECEASRVYYSAGDEPLIQLYDDTAAAWRTTDAAAGNDTTGLGRLDQVQTGWGRPVNQRFLHTVTINDNVGDYLDGTGILKLRISAGDATTVEDTVTLYSANLFSKVYTTYAALGTPYVIDSVDTNKLVFTGQTPNADGVAVNDVYKVGDTLDTVAGFIWQYAPISGITLDFDSYLLFKIMHGD